VSDATRPGSTATATRSSDTRASGGSQRRSSSLVDRLVRERQSRLTQMNSRAAGIRDRATATRTGRIGSTETLRGTRQSTYDSGGRHVSLRVTDRSLRGNAHDGGRTVWVKDRPHDVRHVHHNEHMYYDRSGYAHHRIVWPTYRYIVNYDLHHWSSWNNCWSFRVVYPYYHRKFVFVSLGGYWPVHYSYRRYYWYGSHPYNWYGYYPVPHEVAGNTNNYYTYNYYGADDTGYYDSAQNADYVQPVDHTTFADVRERMAREAAQEPAPETTADNYFEQAVQAFEANDFDNALASFALAADLAPEDTVLPFAYTQALLAKQRYVEAAAVLRQALARVEPQKEGVFFPRGLYSDDAILFAHIDALAAAVVKQPLNADMQLLLGYQLLGIGETDKAVEALQIASTNASNAASATVLLDLIARIKENDVTEEQQQKAVKEESDG